MKKINFLIAVLCTVFSVSLFAQPVQVRGVVVDAGDNSPLPGVSVKVANSQTITTTDVNGEYVITANRGETLEFSCIGMTTQNIVVSGPVLNVALREDATKLEELIVVAYGVVRSEAKTGSIATVSGATLAEVPVTSVDKMLAGKMAGVQITSDSGQPGANSNIRIRGISSINASNEPLWVIDGIPVIQGDLAYFTNTGNALSAYNPSDIESITVLKDAAAASVYGSRAANGVILVTTKRGKEGKSQFSARAKYGVSTMANDNNFRMMNGSELLGYQRQAIINAGRDPDDPSNVSRYRPMSLLDKPQTDWLGILSRKGVMQEFEINSMGGNNKGSYYSSLSYHRNEGVYYGVDFNKVTARVNTDYKLTNTITTGARINLTYQESNDVAMQSLYYANPMFGGIIILPWTPVYDPDGEGFNFNISENANTNPKAIATHDKQYDKHYRLLGSSYIEWKPTRYLTFKTNNAVEATFGDGNRYWSPEGNYGQEDDNGPYGTQQFSTNTWTQLTTSNTITYNDVFNSHSIRVLAGQEAMRRTYSEYFIWVPTVDPLMPIVNTCPPEDTEVEYDYNARTLMSFFGILDYNFAGKYYLQASVREDGSSLFGEKNKWGLFWSVGGSWNVSSEGFMKDQRIVDLLKLRVSYGVNGNNGISPYRAYGVYATTAYNGATGMRPSRPANENLSWERNLTWNVGLDFAFLRRFNASFDLYSRDTQDMLLDKQVPQTSGFSSNFLNIGKINNKGLEFKLDADIIQSKDINWSVGFNLAFNKSKIIDLAGSEFISYSSDARLRHVVGKDFFTFYLYDYYGVNPVNGEPLWRTKDGELTNNFNLADRIYAGSPEPKYIGGFNTSVDWKGLNLSAFFEFKGGNKIFIGEKRYLESDGNQNMNQTVRMLNYWKKPGDTAVNPIPVWGTTSNAYNNSSTRYLQKGDYLRIKDITLSYNLPKKVLDKVKVSNLKLYVSGLNIFTFHKVDWWDPERGVDGMGFGIYPMTKSFIGGIELSF
ncbi:MAG: TonB-dependent receptor [Bacteroidetes bacterium]|nr:TonB-dependent receptor [Bacteroidota bacterium]